MSNKRPTHKLLVAGDDYQNDKGEDKTDFAQIGVAWENDKGNITCKSPVGITVDPNKLIILPITE